MGEGSPKEEYCVTSISESHEATCWGCGLHLILPAYSSLFKCGWCGAITNQNQILRKSDNVCFSYWRRLRDRFFVSIVFFFILFFICAGVWAVYPFVFSVSYFCGIFHCTITAVLSTCTVTWFCLASFKSAGEPKPILWGSYPLVGKDDLENYSFCGYCRKPKPPRAHHCRSCRMCILDMDHHCPFIGNCVGAGNHRFFIGFLASVIVSCIYVTIMTVYFGYNTWPPLDYGISGPLISRNVVVMLKHFLSALASSAVLVSARGLVLIYLAFASLSVEIGISVLLWQQLYYIYEGNTYINRIRLHTRGQGEKGCHNLFRFFSCPYSFSRFFLGPTVAGKLQVTSGSKIL